MNDVGDWESRLPPTGTGLDPSVYLKLGRIVAGALDGDVLPSSGTVDRLTYLSIFVFLSLYSPYKKYT